jgi:hypothetical protein
VPNDARISTLIRRALRRVIIGSMG